MNDLTCLDYGNECQVASDYFDAGYEFGQKEVAAILQDLIAESRAWLAGDHPEPLVWMLNRAEVRLREVSDE